MPTSPIGPGPSQGNLFSQPQVFVCLFIKQIEIGSLKSINFHRDTFNPLHDFQLDSR